MMIEYKFLDHGIIEATSYIFPLHKDVVIGVMEQVPEDEGFWHFFPVSGIPMTAGMCKRLALKLAELNSEKATQ